SEENRITVTVPASGNAELKNGVIVCDHLGDPLGSHRTRIGHEPVYPNFRAVNVKGVYSSMPDIALSRQSEKSDGTSGGGGCAAGAPAFAGIIALAAASAKALAAKKNRRGFLR
ncbi:MAG: hypothetical protein LBQ19_00790, partial [Synergistaceae bacterium]|nr:hypothetical protein [Synergistaceae bacterium]